VRKKENIYVYSFHVKIIFLENYFIVDGMFLNRYLYSSTLAKNSTWSSSKNINVEALIQLLFQ
jgi:hypothetical protein